MPDAHPPLTSTPLHDPPTFFEILPQARTIVVTYKRFPFVTFFPRVQGHT